MILFSHQNWHLDWSLRKHLQQEYRIQGWAIIQFLRIVAFTTVVILYEVHNLYSYAEVAEDFISPEHFKQCFWLTQEFCYLLEIHTNCEDKLQMKNVFYHIVKDAGTIVKASRFSLANPKGSRDALPLHSESELLAAVQTLQAKFLWTLRIMLLNLFFFF